MYDRSRAVRNLRFQGPASFRTDCCDGCLSHLFISQNRSPSGLWAKKRRYDKDLLALAKASLSNRSVVGQIAASTAAENKENGGLEEASIAETTLGAISDLTNKASSSSLNQSCFILESRSQRFLQVIFIPWQSHSTYRLLHSHFVTRWIEIRTASVYPELLLYTLAQTEGQHFNCQISWQHIEAVATEGRKAWVGFRSHTSICLKKAYWVHAYWQIAVTFTWE